MALFLDLCAQPGNIRCLEVLSVSPSSESLCANDVVNNSPGLASSKLPFKTVIELPSPPALTQFNSANVSSSAPPCEFLKSLCASHSNQVEDSICSSCASAQCHLIYFSRQCQVNHLLSLFEILFCNFPFDPGTPTLSLVAISTSFSQFDVSFILFTRWRSLSLVSTDSVNLLHSQRYSEYLLIISNTFLHLIKW